MMLLVAVGAWALPLHRAEPRAGWALVLNQGQPGLALAWSIMLWLPILYSIV